jgi:NAD(P)-dependent dehydrogenase (short-subunit alcohol dehydrogenase family)
MEAAVEYLVAANNFELSQLLNGIPLYPAPVLAHRGSRHRWNAEAIFFLCQKIGPRMKPGGAIVNLSSSSAKLASTIEVATYAASKTTILSITRSFAYALAARPVRVNAICPGIVETPMQDAVLETVGALRGMTADELSAARNRSARPRASAENAGRSGSVVEGPAT